MNAAATRSEHFRALVRGRSATYAMVIFSAIMLVGGATLRDPRIMGGGVLVVILGTVGICWSLADRRARTDFFRAFADSCGLRHALQGFLLPYTPLLGAGDRRRAEHVLEGEIEGQPLSLAQYTYEVRRETPVEGDNDLWQARSFTVAVLPVAAPEGLDAGVYVYPRMAVVDSISRPDWRPAGRKLELESSAFAQRYELRVDDEVDEVAVHQLFAPTLLAWIAEHPLAPGFEYQAGVLVVFVERRLEDEGSLSFLLDTARRLAERFGTRAGAVPVA